MGRRLTSQFHGLKGIPTRELSNSSRLKATVTEELSADHCIEHS